MYVPQPNENHLKLRALAGRWTGREKIHPMAWDPAGGEATAESNTIVAFDGFYVIMDYAQTRWRSQLPRTRRIRLG